MVKWTYDVGISYYNTIYWILLILCARIGRARGIMYDFAQECFYVLPGS